MEETELTEIVAFLQQRLEVEKPDPDEFSTADFVRISSVPPNTAIGHLQRALAEKLISSRKLGRIRYWRIIDRQGWQDWIASKK